MPERENGAIRARAFWSGTISFGLVSIPVNLFAATRGRQVSLRMLAPEGTPLVRRYFDPETGKEVPRDRIVRGYEIEKGQFVVVTDEELSALEPDRTRDIDLRLFVARDAIDPILFDRAYFLTPAGNSSKAYRLLAAVMEQTGRAGVATFVMRTKEYLVAILAENGILRAETLRFAHELRGVDEIELPERRGVSKAEVGATVRAIRDLAADALDESELEDAYAARLLDLVERKRKQRAGVVTAAVVPEDEEEEGAEVIDLMEALKRSLGVPERAARRAAPARRSKPGGAESPVRAPGRGPGRRGSPDLASLTKAELYERAQELDIPGRSSMNKDQLVRALRRSA